MILKKEKRKSENDRGNYISKSKKSNPNSLSKTCRLLCKFPTRGFFALSYFKKYLNWSFQFSLFSNDIYAIAISRLTLEHKCLEDTWWRFAKFDPSVSRFDI